MEKNLTHQRKRSTASIRKQKQAQLCQNNNNKYIVENICSISGSISTRKFIKNGLLGSGGFANCYIVQNLQTKKRAAVKIIMKDILTSYHTKLRLRNQIKIHKTLHHQNIVEFYHHFQDKDNVYIFLQLCENQSLNQLIRVRQVFTTPQIQAFIYGIVQGLKYLHSKHIIHRDLKLGNLFVDDKLNIKIGDFGLATKLQFERQFKRTICGTPNYIAPQVLNGKGYHFQIDIWSVGVIMYTLYLGYPPFQTDQASLTYKKIKQCDYTAPSRSQGVPSQAIDLIKKILVKNPANRPTLDEILQSNFMNLGKGVPMNLPMVCIKKAPSCKDFNENSFLVTKKNYLKHKRIPSAVLIEKKYLAEKQKELSYAYVTQINKLPNNQYIYQLNNGSRAVLTKNGYLLFRQSNNRLIHLNIKKKSLVQLANTVNDQFTLITEQLPIDKENQTKLIIQNKQFKDLIYVNKITKYKDFYMLRLNNFTIELLFENNQGFFITYPQQIYYFNKDQIRWVSSTSIMECMTPQLNIEQDKLQYVKAILIQIRNKKSKSLNSLESL